MRLRMLAMIVLTVLAVAPARAADPPCSIVLGPRTACMTPVTSRQGRADGGIIDVQLTASNVLVTTLTGTAAANAFLGCESSAAETFHLEQQFEVAGPSTGVTEVTLMMESNLTGLVRAKSHSGAAARIASAKICPLGAPDSPLVMVHPAFGVNGTAGRLCNQRLTPIKVPGMPVGRYVLTADFVLTSIASGLVDDHSAADFSPTTTLPADWVRSRDPFQGVDKKDFGFRVSLTVEPVGASLATVLPALPHDAQVARTAAQATPPTSHRLARPTALTGLDRHSTPR